MRRDVAHGRLFGRKGYRLTWHFEFGAAASSELSVDLDHLDQIVTKLADLAGFIGERLDEIDDRVATLAGTGWESVAALAYTDAHREWAVGAREFVEGLMDISDAAKKAHENIAHAVDLHSKMLNGG
ncbi:WXG100 family type VII secretion target [Nocardia jinanensis]|uniref:WXG100 family type VII secretion target n=1 Tax=Nocardia jinanensis TaxID=382504 RepID=A0A917RWW0_9NOCA|nr:WXG100 family type VII secretion target [Nocardia jinanensis]GGL42870.1 hypothetical protein GCM10011588_67040 [Nocardia jinanensis]